MAELNWRSSAVKAIKRIHARVLEGAMENRDVFHLQQELKSLESHFERFMENHNRLVGGATSTEMGPHDALLESVEELYTAACSRLNRLIASSRVESNVADGTQNCPTTSLDGHLVDLKLDPLAIPLFDGDMCKWLAFKDAFETLVHNSTYPEAFKLGKLRQAVNATTVPLIGGIYSGGYQEVWKALKDRYDNKKQLAEIHVSRFLNLKPTTHESSQTLLTIVDTVHESLRALRVMDIPINQWDALAVPIVVAKLPAVTKRDWCMRCSTTDIPQLEDLLKFLERRAHSLAPEPSVSVIACRQQRPLRAHVATTDAALCAHCGLAHRIVKCPAILALSIEQRFEALKRLKLCYNCLRSSHSYRQCSSGNCRNCGRKHNTILCRDKFNNTSTFSSTTTPAVCSEVPTEVPIITTA
ncbi:uncharacterized protein LOC126755733 [Bactrocera neohumeralis]|uniref:uncharacterized protein LOC126755733 n=1 Tax=Bactrocera neohumeralis TaxID=98809 RepID=UPI0021665047|nr:uncharacterized protein LOC126755733 [Bactrocera neohumeralis]